VNSVADQRVTQVRLTTEVARVQDQPGNRSILGEELLEHRVVIATWSEVQPKTGFCRGQKLELSLHGFTFL
jgi:hypothetical protein